MIALGVNMVGSEASVPQMIQGKTMPLLQDNVQARAMAAFLINKDDLLILRRDGSKYKQVHTGGGQMTILTQAGLDTLTHWVVSIP